MHRRLSRLTAGLLSALLSCCLLSATAHAYTLTNSGNTLTIQPSVSASTTQPVALTGTVSGPNVVFTPAADATGLANCTNSGNTTSCPTSDFSTQLTIDDAYVVTLTGLQTGTLDLEAAVAQDQFSLPTATISGALELNPNNSAVALNASGKIAALTQVGKSDSGTLSMNLQTGATTGSLTLSGASNYIDAPASALNVTSSGGDATITAGGSITATGGNNLIHAVSTTQLINGGGSSAVDFLDMTTPLTLTLQDQPGGGAENVFVAALGAATPTTPTVTNIDSLTGSSGGDTMVAAPGSGADVLTGGPGANTFIPNNGPDQINGGTGNDNTIDYATNPTAVTVNLVTGSAGPTGGLPASQVQLTNIQNVILGDAPGDTVVAGSFGGTFAFGNGAGDSFTGGSGTDIVTMGTGAGDVLTGGTDASIFNVGAGSGDTLTGGSGASQMSASGPGVTFIAGWGQNTIVGGGGDDTVSYQNRTQAGQGVTVTLSDSGASTGNGQPGENDSLTGIQNIIGGSGYNILTGDSANNTIVGGPNGNQITGGGGNDTLIGGAGNDIINSGSGSGTTISGNGGDDSIDATAGTDVAIDCGASNTSAVLVNATDTWNGDCTNVTNPSIVPTTTTSTPPVVNPCTYVLPGQTCGGKTEPYPTLATQVEPNWTYIGNYYTEATEMTLQKLQKGSGVSMSCRTPSLGKHGCPFHSYVKDFSVARADFSVLSQFKKAQMAPGTTITIRVTNPLAVGIYQTYRVRADNRRPVSTSGCLSPTTGKVLKCPASGYYTPPS